MLENFRLKFLSKKGEINDLFESFKQIAGEEKREIGKQLNVLRQSIEAKFNESKEKFSSEKKFPADAADLSLPTNANTIGSLHPISLVKNSIINGNNTNFFFADGSTSFSQCKFIDFGGPQMSFMSYDSKKMYQIEDSSFKGIPMSSVKSSNVRLEIKCSR
jgi:hypothetical protein